jgi:hypothetical protein
VLPLLSQSLLRVLLLGGCLACLPLGQGGLLLQPLVVLLEPLDLLLFGLQLLGVLFAQLFHEIVEPLLCLLLELLLETVHLGPGLRLQLLPEVRLEFREQFLEPVPEFELDLFVKTGLHLNNVN